MENQTEPTPGVSCSGWRDASDGHACRFSLPLGLPEISSQTVLKTRRTSSGSGTNQRIDCPFACEGDHASKREIAVDTDNAAKQWKCHAYGCECRGNLLNLMYGWLNGKRWTGDKLRGAEFNQKNRTSYRFASE